MHHYKRIYATLLGLWLVIAVQMCRAEEATEKADSPQKMSQAIMRGINSFLLQERLEVDISIQWHIQEKGVGQYRRESMRVSIQRPDCLKVVGLNGLVDTEINVDGEEGVVFSRLANDYWHGNVSGKIQELVNKSDVLAQSLANPLIQSIIEGKWERAINGLKGVGYLGTETIEGVTLHKLRLKNSQKNEPEATVWVSEQDGYRPQHLVYDLNAWLEGVRQNPMATAMPEKMSLEIIYTWNDKPVWDDDFFTVVEPAHAKQVIYFGSGNENQHELVGMMAPEYDLTLLDGSKKALSSYHDESVVVLDFWAIRCPPCRAGLPVLDKIAEEYRDKGVIFYAVNVEDSAVRIKDFFEELKIDPPAARDIDGKGGRLFKVTGIPQTVIIDTKGKIQSIHQGYGEETPIHLRAELDALLAGVDIASLGDREPVKVDLACESAALTAVAIEEETRQEFSCVLSNKGLGNAPAYSYLVLVYIDGKEALLRSGTTAIDAGETVTYTVPADEWNVQLAPEAKANVRVLVWPSGTLQDSNHNNNSCEMPSPASSD